MSAPLLSRVRPYAIMPLMAAPVALIGFWLLFHQLLTPLVAGMALCFLLAVFYQNRERGIYLGLFFLVFLGDIRRIWSNFNGFGAYDLLVLVGPAFVTLISVPIFIKLRLRDIQSKLAFGVTVMMILQIFNPGQGGVAVGLSGVLLTLPPLLWFWVGRTYGTEKMMRFVAFRIIVPSALIASFVGLYQTYFGIPFWQQGWVQYQLSLHSAVLQIGTGIRAFGFSTIPSEYMSLILLACYFCVMGVMTGRRVLLLSLAVLLPTLFLASSRGRVFSFLIATVLGYTFKSRNKVTFPIRMAFAVTVAFGGMALVLSQNGDEAAATYRSSAASAEISHQVNGLAHPFDKKYSTAGLHQGEIVVALFAALKHPIGYGTGSTYGGGAKFGAQGESIGSEFDITDSFVNLGLPGGILYTGFIISIIWMGFRYTRFGPKDLSLAIFAMMIPQLGQWLFPGEYGNGALFFFLLGSMVHVVTLRSVTETAATDDRISAIRDLAPVAKTRRAEAVG